MSPRLSIAVAVLLVSPLAGADESAVDPPALATDLFEAGLKKMEAGRCEENPIGDRAVCAAARDDFRRAYELYPAGLGALRNLAFVEKGLGLVASSARHFRELARKAPLDPKPARRLWADFANKELEGLEPRVPHLTLKVPADAPESTRVAIDGASVPRAAWSLSIDVDPGAHEIRAEASGHKPFAATIALGEGESKSVDVALLSDGSVPSAPAPDVTKREVRIAPLILTGAGAATVVVGLGLGWAAIKKHDDVCPRPGCDPNAWSEGKALARASTIVTGVGLAAVGSGIAWYLLGAPREGERGATIVPSASATGGGLHIVGNF